MGETAQDLLKRAESAGFACRRASGLTIATLPAAMPATEAEPILQELAARAPELSLELKGRNENAFRRRLTGRPAFCPASLQAGVVDAYEPSGELIVRCQAPGGGMSRISWARSEAMLISDASPRTARLDLSRASGDTSRNRIREAEKGGIRLWAESGLVVFGWPDLEEATNAPRMIRQALREAAEWGVRIRGTNMAGDVLANDAISDEFVRHVAGEAPIVYEFQRLKRSDRETAAHLLLLGQCCLGDLRRMLSCLEQPELEPEAADLEGARAILCESGSIVTIESVGGLGIVCRDRTGRTLRFRPESLLVVEDERAVTSAAALQQKPGLLSFLRW